ncbi:MAG TPA: Lacal_2735 family protein [Flavobacteriaceae bacterium]|nr:Lacal_2735 family protein [Flavobacteriaceae bacterium]
MMNPNDAIITHQLELNKEYKELIEQAYNLRQTDSELSDISEYKAIKLLDELNRLKYLYREIQINVS